MESNSPQNTAVNPYQPPATEVLTAPRIDSPGSLIPDGRAVAASHGWDWIAGGWRIFAQSPLKWVLMSVTFFVLIMVLSVIPGVSLLVYLGTPVLMAGFVIGADHLRRGESLEIGHLFAGFKRNFSSLLAIGGIYLGSIVAVIMIVGLLGAILFFVGGGWSGMGNLRSLSDLLASGFIFKMLLLVLLALAAIVPVMMAMWFAPALVVMHDIPAVNAMIMSFKGCLKNFLPFLVYGLLASVIMVISMIPLGLGLFITWPMLYTALYASYRDIFVAPE